MKQTGKRISHGPALVMAQSQEEGLTSTSCHPQTLYFFESVMSVQKWLLAFNFPSATVQMGNVGSGELLWEYTVKITPSMWFTFYCQTRKAITSFNKHKPKKEMGLDVSLLVGQHKGTAICLSALQTDLTTSGQPGSKAWPSNTDMCTYPGGLERDCSLPNLHWPPYLSSIGLLWKIPFWPRLFFL